MSIQLHRALSSSELTERMKQQAVSQGKARIARRIESASELTERVRKEASIKLPTQYNTANRNSAEFATEFFAGQAFRRGELASKSKIQDICCPPIFLTTPSGAPAISVQRSITCSQPIKGSSNDVRCIVPSNVTPNAGVRAPKGTLQGTVVPNCVAGLRPQSLQS